MPAGLSFGPRTPVPDRPSGLERSLSHLPDRGDASLPPHKPGMREALGRAIDNREFHLVYQPQFDLETNEIMGIEALLRWNNAEFGDVPPAEFIPVAEDDPELIQAIGRWVLRRACEESAEMQRQLGRRLGLAVNLSPAQFAQPDLPELVRAVLADSGLSPNMLELEITEGVFVLDAERTIQTLNTIRAMGVAISIDDFGTGYSSLSYLTRFTVDWIKIDQSFVHDLPHGKNASVVTTAIISIAHSLGMMVIAEGIETREQHDYLLARGCDLGQGYWFSKPLPMAELVPWIAGGARSAARIAQNA